MASAMLFAVRRLRRGWRSGELFILVLALAVAVAASAAVNLFTERVRSALDAQTGEALGGDVLYSARRPLPPSLSPSAQALGLRTTELVHFTSVVFHGDASQLASIKAVGAGYPLRGALRVSSEPFGPARAAAGVPARGEAWVDARLWQALRLFPGAMLKVGALELRVSAVIQAEPDRGNGFADLAPRLMMNGADVADSQLLGPGSRAQYSLLVAGDAPAVQAVLAQPVPDGVRRQTPREARPEIRNALSRAGQFLDIAIVAATLLAAAAVALSARQYGEKLRDEIALLKCLGARQGFLVRALLLQLVLLGAAAALAGAAVGYLAQAALARVLADLMQLELPPPPLKPLLAAAALGGLMLLGFAAPPMLDARRTLPLRVFQRDLAASPLSRSVWIAAFAAAAALLWLASADTRLVLIVLAGIGLSAVALALLAWLLVLALQPLRRRVGISWRFGLGNVARRRAASVAQVTALGLALLALLLVSVVREDLLRSWQRKLPADTPNQFLINIQTDQVQPLRAFFQQRGYPALELWPMARGRLVELNGTPVTADSFPDPETQRWINRDFNLSWSTTLNPDNRITQGQWWGEAGRGQPWLSADEYAIERLHLKLGDTLTLDFAGERVTLTVHNFRTVEWDSFRPNFFLLAPPGVVPETVPTQWLTSFYLPPGDRALLRELIDAFPNVTVLDIEAMMNQVRGIIDRIVTAVEFIFLFTLAAGVTVLLAAIEGTRAERIRETALLRTLGARAGLIARGLLAEYAVLGALAGFIAAIASQTVAWVLAAQVFGIAYGPRPHLWALGTLGGAVLVALLGGLSLRRVLHTPPRRVLQQI
ncbi:putative ABC transport system permease protein [Fontimonas thermophila]|uniref:Putative ABC transport system permease protein n=1 Tax=Fontimonas thermophila TaxID=1076937 RepID=A0A1I2JFZ7_9GAMM|nr:FtsX-like permease family protein [Fontimonas thermophila]SFF53018.1 putative ABC transport system permease protein [Fontimonas thermophila]